MSKLVSDLGLGGAPLETKDIIRELVRMEVKRGREIVMPNYTPEGWWECDVLSVSDAQYATEFEVKISRADFFRDFGKEKRQGDSIMAKHDRLMLDNRIITEFWFAMPAHMVAVRDIPQYAGVIYFWRDDYGVVNGRAVRNAQRFNEARISLAEIDRIRRNAHFRFINAVVGGRL